LRLARSIHNVVVDGTSDVPPHTHRCTRHHTRLTLTPNPRETWSRVLVCMHSSPLRYRSPQGSLRTVSVIISSSVQCHHPRQHADAGGRVASKVRERLRTSCGRQSPNACAYEEPLTGGAPRRRERRQPPPRAPSATRSPARHAADQVPSGRDAASPLPLQRPHDGLSTPATSGGPARYQHHPGR